jgi:hypothetical protein
MQELKVTYEVRVYGDDYMMLVRTEEKNVKGLPPTHSQCIMMNKSEIEDLMLCLQKMKSRNSVS